MALGTLVVAVVISVAIWASLYSRWLWYVPPDPHKLEVCVADGFDYRWYVPSQGYVCHDNWTFPGFHGV
jgi:hypothetical protein